jgi:excisionase family DNA binding protein
MSKLLTAEQLSQRWQVPTSYVYRLARDGRVPAVRLGRYVRFREDVIERFELGVDDTDAHAA